MAQVGYHGRGPSGPRSLPAILNQQTVSSTPLSVQPPKPKPKQRTPPPSTRQPQDMSASPMATPKEWTPSASATTPNCSSATLDNARYELGKHPRKEHENEDRCFIKDKGNYQVFGVFDGHDGTRAVGFSSNYFAQLFDMPSWKKVVDNKESDEQVMTVLKEFFRATEDDFFRSLDWEIEKKGVYSALIPPGLTSYEAQMNFPQEVYELQQIEERINGGSTAVLAVIANRKLYVANVGDSRALIIRESPNGVLYCEQLSEDHSVYNEGELSRLAALGLDRESLTRSGRVGMHENTRSIGDYYIKSGYRDVDILMSARGPPGIAVPYVASPTAIDHDCRYLVLMTDGVYKSLEGLFENESSVEANKVLVGMIKKADKGADCSTLADSIISLISKRHQETFQEAATRDPRSRLAVNCRKRDDMTCVIYKFPPVAKPRTIPPSTQAAHSAPNSLQKH